MLLLLTATYEAKTAPLSDLRTMLILLKIYCHSEFMNDISGFSDDAGKARDLG